MKNLKLKLFCTLFILFFSFIAKADYDFTVDGLFYKVISFENLTCACVDEINTPNYLPNRSNYSGDIVIPSSVTIGARKFSVVEVSAYAFWRSTITSLRIGGGVKTIQYDAFRGCEQLTSVYLEDGVEEIKSYAFVGCENLRKLVLPNTLQRIGDYAFYDELWRKPGVKVINIPNTCKFIGNEAFAKTPSEYPYVVKILEGPSALEICNYSFGQTRLKSIHIGRNLSSECIYTGIYNAEEIYFEDNVTFMPDCCQGSSSKSDAGRILTLVIGKSISKVPLMEVNEIKMLHVRNPRPPKAEGFSKSVYVNTTLFVPKGSLEAYRNDDVWNNFWTIKEED